ncbi:hypothetical protein FNYG_13308 [Fusarium nygamai]|uniref:Heterokaryon incompatibility domain-containing protein n=1 Tax=Gibberella nygamai TaxID=42673 RepID=A0A2K0VTJ4_GIBNY|nr:hypothetical protein FNYG_13308 [Fusarium nygamai]
MPSAYKYRQLNEALYAIRLIHLVQAQHGEIQCRIELASLDSPPPYKALSYTWGSERLPRRILVDGSWLAVTENLYIALIHLRQRTQDLPLWVDAICIDQKDKEEKSWQVRQMRRVYEEAREVLIWLGPSHHDSNLAMSKIEDAGRLALRSGLSIIQERDQLKWTTILRENRWMEAPLQRLLDKLEFGDSQSAFPVDALMALFSRPWWSRVWVVQEIAVSRGAQFRCGDYIVPADFFCAGMNLMGLKRVSIITRNTRTPIGWVTLSSLESRIIYKDYDRRPFQMVQMWKNPGRQPLLSLLKLISQCPKGMKAALEAYDPSDKVYACLGLSNDSSTLGISANYKVPAKLLYTRVAEALIRRCVQSRVCIDFYGLCQQPKNLAGLPSWVPDWSSPLITTIRADYMPPFSACGNTAPEAEFTDRFGTQVLSMPGVVVDSVLAVGSPFRPIDGRPIAATRAFLQEFIRLTAKGGDIYSDDEQIEALWRTPITDMERDGDHWRRARESTIRTYEAILKGDETAVWLNEETQSYHSRSTMALERRPFVTRKGYLGLGPTTTQSGNVVAVLRGTEIPIMVRQRRASKDEVYGYLVGECYVHGIMDGECFFPRSSFSLASIHLL